MSKYVYIAFISTNTTIGKIIRKLTGWKYSHVSVSLDPNLIEYHAFARKNNVSAFDAGYNLDYKSNYTSKLDLPVHAVYYKIPVTKEEYLKISKFIEEIANDREYIFNLLSMVTTTILHGFEIYKSYNCITFTSIILTYIKKVKLSKKYYKYDLNELENDVKDFYYKEETYTFDKIEPGNDFFDYIEPRKIRRNRRLLIRENFYRLFFKKMSKRYKKYIESDNYI